MPITASRAIRIGLVRIAQLASGASRLLDFPINLGKGETARLILRYGKNAGREQPDNPLRVVETKDGVTLLYALEED